MFARFASASGAEDVAESRAQTPLTEKDDDNAGHGKTLEGTVACCRKYSDGLVNCESCLNLALDVWFVQSNAKQREVCRHVLNLLEAAGSTGLDMNTLIVSALQYLWYSTSLIDNSTRQSSWSRTTQNAWYLC